MAKNLTFQQARTGIFDHVFAEWVTTFPGGSLRTPVELPNKSFKAPNNNTWLRVILSFAEGIDSTQLNPTPINFQPGLLSLDIMVPIRKGQKAAYDLVDFAVNMFNRRTIPPGIQFRASSPTTIVAEDPFYRLRVDTPFWFYTCGNIIPPGGATFP